MLSPSFNPGDAVVWRSCQTDHVGYVLTAFVVVDTPDLIAVYQPSGAPVLRRGGNRQGPNGRSLPPGGWDGTHNRATFNGPPAIRAHQPGASYSVIRHLHTARLTGWYANPERPWVRTVIGYDSKDLIVDVTFSGDGFDEPTLKDVDELDWNRERGVITDDEHAEYLSAAHRAMGDARSGRGVFDADWDGLVNRTANQDLSRLDELLDAAALQLRPDGTRTLRIG